MHWRAKYINGETVTEEDGVSSDRLNRTMLSEVSILDGKTPVYTLELVPERKFFYRKRTTIRPGQGSAAIHILGYKEGDKWHIAVVHDSHKTEEFDSFNKKHAYLYPPAFMPHEDLKI